MKGGVEAGHLRQFRIEPHRHPDRGEIVGLVQWRQRHQRFELGEQFGGYAGRLGITHPAMDHTVAERGKPPPAELFLRPGQ